MVRHSAPVAKAVPARAAVPPASPAPPSSPCRRRSLVALPPLLGLAAAAGSAAPAWADAAAEPSPALASAAGAAGPGARPGSLAARMATTGSIQQPGVQPPWAPKQIYYPRWMFGEWQVDMVFSGLHLPLGRQYVPDGFLQAAEASAEEGGLGSRYALRLRFYSTLPPTLDNQLRVNLGLGPPRDAIVADRAYNTRQTTDAFLGWEAVESVVYDPRDAPLRETVTLSRLGPDMSPLPPRRLELYINALSSEEGEDGREEAAGGLGVRGGAPPTFYTSEMCRQVLLGVRQAEVKDYEIMHSWRQLAPGRLAGRQRSCLYLQPQERLYFAAGGRAVAVYDYELSATRVAAPGDAPPGAVACVATPKGISQCI